MPTARLHAARGFALPTRGPTRSFARPRAPSVGVEWVVPRHARTLLAAFPAAADHAYDPAMASDEVSAPGWDAIDRAVFAIHQREPDHHFGMSPPPGLSDNALNGISAYRVDLGGRTGFHLVTYGLTELFDKESDDADTSGFGFELTMRVVADEGLDTPPMWAMNFLHNLAKYVARTGIRFGVGHHMHANGPIAADRSTALHAVVFAEDPQLGTIETPNGEVQFLTVVGITTEEREAIQTWNAAGVLGVMKPRLPLLLTDLGRRSLMEDEAFAAAMQDGAAREGSSQSVAFRNTGGFVCDGERVVVTMGANDVVDFARLLRGRIAFHRSFVVRLPAATITFEPGERVEWAGGSDAVVVRLPATSALQLAKDVRPVRGELDVAACLRIRVVPTEIKDQEGRVVRTVG